MESHGQATSNSPWTTGGPEPAPSVGGIFSGSQNFTVNGGIFNSITRSNRGATRPPDFPEILLGNIDLRRQIRADGFRCSLGIQQGGNVRRVYAARVEGSNLDMTVAVYQGESAEEEWRKDVSRYSRLRHPNFVQLCGVTTSSLVHATIFHDDLIPLENFLELYQNSPLLTVYVHAYCSTEFWEANDYFSSVSRQRLCITECTFWIRRSTGKLCADLISTNMGHRVQSPHPDCSSYEIGFSQVPNQQIKTVDSLSVEKYHEICYWDVSQVRHMHMCTPVTVNLGAVISWSSTRGEETLLTIASLPCVDLPERRWHITRGPRGVVVDGWTRFRVEEVMNHTLRVHIWHWNPECWLSQANYIFDCLQLEPDAHDCVIVDNITFSIPIQALPDDYLDLYLPTLSPNELETRRRRCEGGYLFLCPVNDFRTGPCSFRAPDLPAYWSLGPSGVNRLSPEDANRLGFPSLQLATTVQGKSWDRQTYAELGRFHRAKGFDPTSQDVARYLGDPLYYLPQEDASSGRDECPEDDAAADRKAQQHQPPEVSSVSPMFKLVMNVQLTLIIFLMVSWLNSWRG